jgi:hypothetical protein
MFNYTSLKEPTSLGSSGGVFDYPLLMATVIKVLPTYGASVFQRNTRIALCITATIIRILLNINLNAIVEDALHRRNDHSCASLEMTLVFFNQD